MQIVYKAFEVKIFFHDCLGLFGELFRSLIERIFFIDWLILMKSGMTGVSFHLLVSSSGFKAGVVGGRMMMCTERSLMGLAHSDKVIYYIADSEKRISLI